MTEKPTYEELKKKVQELEKDSIVHSQLQDALRKSEENWRSLTKNSPDHIMLLDLDYNIQFINHTVPDLTIEEVIGKSNLDFAPPDQHKRAIDCFERVIKSGKPDRYETQYITAEREIQFFDVRVAPVIGEDGNVGGLISSSNNVTDRKRTEEALRESEDKLIEAQKIAKLGYYVFDIKKGYWTSSAQLDDIFGIDENFKRDVASWLQIVHPDNRETLSNYLQDNILSQHEKFDKEYKIINLKTGQEKWVHGLGSLKSENNSSPVKLFGTIQDITERKKAEKALRESENKFRTVAEQSPNMIFINKKGRVVYQNKRSEEIMGYKSEEICSPDFDFLTLLAPGSLELAKSSFKKHMDGNDVGTLEYNLIRKDGKQIKTVINTKLIDYENERAILGFVTDVTERKRAEEALLESEEKYRSLLDDVVDRSEVGLFILDSDFSVVWVNKALERYFGLKREEIVGKDKRQLILGKIKYKFEDPQGFAERVLATYDDNTYVENFECHMVPGDTREGRWLEHWSQPIRSGLYAGGRVELYYDITERKKATFALKESQQRYREFVEGTDDLITRVDAEGRFIYVNHVAEKILGISRKKCIGMSAFDFIHPDDRERTQTEFAGWIRNRLRSITIENRQVNQTTGEVYEMMWSSNLHYDERGNLTGINGIARDLTERKKLEEAILKSQKLESLGILAGGIAHDFNNLLSVIMVNLSLVEGDIKPETGTLKFLKEAEKASLRARNLAARLITFSKGGEPVKKAIPIWKLVKDSVISSLSGTDINCEFSIPDDLSIVKTDETQMKQAIHNIVVNAQEAIAGKGVIKVDGENVTVVEKDSLPLKDGKYVKISISDQGAGIPEENLEKIFDPYFSTKEMGTEKGMGLGLSICNSIVEKHDGLITVESKLGTGTTFIINLPASDKEIAELEPIKKPVPEKPVIGRGKVLLMDDEKMIRDFAILVLNRLGYDAEVSKDGTEAIQLYKKAKESGEPFDAVILDLTNQFGMGGKEAIQKLIEIDPHVKGIVSTGYSDDVVVTDFKKYGFCGTLIKPYSIDELKNALNKVVPVEPE